MRGDQRDRDLEAFSWFFTTEYPQVVRLLRVVVQDAAAAEDLAQDAFVRLHRHWEKVSRYENPEAWIRRVALNRAFSQLRRDRLRRTVEVASVDRSAVSPDSAVAATSRADVLRALRQLSHREAALVGLYHLEDRPMTEVAEVLGMSTGSAKVALHRARRRLAELLAEAEAST
jgi:RNA polymerase sigma factor (sigma-70 family)